MIDVLFYNLGVGLYATGIQVASAFKPKAKLFVDGRHGLQNQIRQKLANEKRLRIWVHCASLGEFEQGRPVIEALRSTYPGYAIVLTFFSPSGYEVRKNYDGADHIFYLPVDSAANAKWFLDLVHPSVAVFVKYELWYHYLKALNDRRIPTLLISAIFNKDHGFFKWYGGLQRKMLGMFTSIIVQDNDSKELLSGIGINNVLVGGDTRFDRVVAAAVQQSALPVIDTFGAGHKLLVAGSTWSADEEMLKCAMAQLPANWKLVLVPHEVDDAHIAAIEKMFGSDVVKWSTWDNKLADKRVLLVDKIGLLLQLYSYGNAAFIGGGFGKEGVHNVLEAAVYGIPCAYGPVYHKFREAEELIAVGGATGINNDKELSQWIARYNNDAEAAAAGKAGKDYVMSKQGATEKVLHVLQPFITNK